jgi:transcriptional regulator with XRE-family HTH domain
LWFTPGIVRFLEYVPAAEATSFADRLRLMRRLSGLSLLRLAGLLGVDEGTVRRWERGRSRPKPAVAERLEALLDIST